MTARDVDIALDGCCFANALSACGAGAADRDGVVVTQRSCRLGGDPSVPMTSARLAAIGEALDADVCGALGLPRGSVRNVQLPGDGSVATFDVHHPASMTARDVDSALDGCCFANALSACGAGAADRDGVVVTQRSCRLGGDPSVPMTSARLAAIGEALDADVCGALGLPRGSVRNVQLPGDGSVATFDVHHPASMTARDVDSALDGCCFANALSACGAGAADRDGVVVTQRSCRLGGDPSVPMTSARLAAIGEALDADVCGALGLPRGSVRNVQLPGDGSVATFDVHHPASMTARDVDSGLDGCCFANALSACGAGAADRDGVVVTQRSCRLGGDPSVPMTSARLAAIGEALDADVCGALGLPRGSVRNVFFIVECCTFCFDVHHPASMTARDVDSALDGCCFANAFRCFSSFVFSSSFSSCLSLFSVSEHFLLFDFNVCPYVSSQFMILMEKALNVDISSSLSVDGLSVRNLSLFYDCSLLSFDVCYPATVQKVEVDRCVENCTFKYLSRVCSHSDFVSGSTVFLDRVSVAVHESFLLLFCSIFLLGSGWSSVYNLNTSAIAIALNMDVCSSLTLQRDCVRDVVVDFNCSCVTFTVVAPRCIDQRAAEEALRASPFANMWKLHDPNNCISLLERARTMLKRGHGVACTDAFGPKPGFCSVEHVNGLPSLSSFVSGLFCVGFCGRFWTNVVDNHYQELIECVVSDLASEQLFATSIQGCSRISSLNIVIRVCLYYSKHLSSADVLRILDVASFSSSWQLYKRLYPQSHLKRVSSFHCLRVAGEGWHNVSNMDELKLAVVGDIIECLRLVADSVDILRYDLRENLSVEFYVFHDGSLDSCTIDKMLAQSPLTRLLTLHRSYCSLTQPPKDSCAAFVSETMPDSLPLPLPPCNMPQVGAARPVRRYADCNQMGYDERRAPKGKSNDDLQNRSNEKHPEHRWKVATPRLPPL
ncbi:hypothetical protein, conserved in T. vivax [Trypanosoma vivax Y486]|uniref:Flagellar attachment zone protein 1 conserved domain-containing protein n=1 Tax=Trypanosoma vivax (strain Y486) TaxID=1055687 RepID=F9WRX5_TRYVY|nr:hypothetical protein, conserved in T. vivax [Trypanosoma vivax Y486]|eukprot:CCD20311.1 hypothetical protein, conserved in T. vivax [Trypanosoma vivax Y486]